MGSEWVKRVRDLEVRVTDNFLTLERPGWRLDIDLFHVYAVELTESWFMVILGVMLVIVSFVIPMLSSEIGTGASDIAIVVFLVGLAIATYGWRNRFVVTVYYGQSKFSLRDGRPVKELAEEVRKRMTALKVHEI
ncbi:MAG: hypothetical protein GSR84_03085 [Desulfurococcales archaeon]|nr:hypothetical protein [Desulfurococcales archaeon]